MPPLSCRARPRRPARSALTPLASQVSTSSRSVFTPSAGTTTSMCGVRSSAGAPLAKKPPTTTRIALSVALISSARRFTVLTSTVYAVMPTTLGRNDARVSLNGVFCTRMSKSATSWASSRPEARYSAHRGSVTKIASPPQTCGFVGGWMNRTRIVYPLLRLQATQLAFEIETPEMLVTTLAAGGLGESAPRHEQRLAHLQAEVMEDAVADFRGDLGERAHRGLSDLRRHHEALRAAPNIVDAEGDEAART